MLVSGGFFFGRRTSSGLSWRLQQQMSQLTRTTANLLMSPILPAALARGSILRRRSPETIRGPKLQQSQGQREKSTGQRQDLPATTRRRTKGPPDTPDKKLGSHLEACQKYIDSLTELSVDSVWRNVIRAAEAASFWGEAFKCGSCEVGQPKLDQDSVPNIK